MKSEKKSKKYGKKHIKKTNKIIKKSKEKNYFAAKNFTSLLLPTC
jgi:hypothetical protein